MTDLPFNRRRFLVATGGAASLTGCLGRAGEFLGGSGDDGGDPAPDLELRFPAIDTGELVDNFEDMDRWTIGVGELSVDTDEAVHGTQSMRLDSAPDGDSASAFALLDEPLDLSDRHLSVAVKVESDANTRIRVRLLAPDRQNRIEASRTILADLDDWIRIDFGYTGTEGDPDLSAVQELRLAAESFDGAPVRARFDDLRARQMGSGPKAVLVFDGAFSSHYDTVFPLLEDRGGAGVLPVSRASVRSGGGLGVTELRELRDAGWDIASRPQIPEPLPALEPEEQESIITDNHDYLAGRGFTNGARHFFPPGYAMDGTTVDIAREVHDSIVTFGGCPNANPPTSRFALSRFDGDQGSSTTRLIDLAGRYNQSIVLGFSRIGHEDGLSTDEFEARLEYLAERGFELVSLSTLLDA